MSKDNQNKSIFGKFLRGGYQDQQNIKNNHGTGKLEKNSKAEEKQHEHMVIACRPLFHEGVIASMNVALLVATGSRGRKFYNDSPGIQLKERE